MKNKTVLFALVLFLAPPIALFGQPDLSRKEKNIEEALTNINQEWLPSKNLKSVEAGIWVKTTMNYRYKDHLAASGGWPVFSVFFEIEWTPNQLQISKKRSTILHPGQPDAGLSSVEQRGMRRFLGDYDQDLILRQYETLLKNRLKLYVNRLTLFTPISRNGKSNFSYFGRDRTIEIQEPFDYPLSANFLFGSVTTDLKNLEIKHFRLAPFPYGQRHFIQTHSFDTRVKNVENGKKITELEGKQQSSSFTISPWKSDRTENVEIHSSIDISMNYQRMPKDSSRNAKQFLIPTEITTTVEQRRESNTKERQIDHKNGTNHALRKQGNATFKFNETMSFENIRINGNRTTEESK